MLGLILLMASAPATFLDVKLKGGPYTASMLRGTPLDRQDNPLYGVTAVDILVDPAGRPSSCNVITQMKVTPLGNWVCGQLLRNGRFYPANDQSGRPIYGVFTFWFRQNLYDTLASIPDRSTFWVPVNALPAGVGNPRAEVRYLVGVEGKTEGCEVSATSKSAVLDKHACDATRAMDFFPIADKRGVPLRTVRTRTIGFKVRN
ncbi:energy transducer TonB family protein [Sphingomonas sp. ERG5]|uniref:energy transducer TonB family protein n=1 Tax=Sphingomonas sp. ERG5 TaxID=1381597 RepID=UPI00054B332F|nr:energy transducer TonB [Sphingomonas sp. ERG5]